MKARLQFKKVVNKLTPSGHSDNGQHLVSDDGVSFTIDDLDRAVLEDCPLKGDKFYDPRDGSKMQKIDAARVTIDGKTWTVKSTINGIRSLMGLTQGQ